MTKEPSNGEPAFWCSHNLPIQLPPSGLGAIAAGVTAPTAPTELKYNAAQPPLQFTHPVDPPTVPLPTQLGVSMNPYNSPQSIISLRSTPQSDSQ
jgi:hypothetical protein